MLNSLFDFNNEMLTFPASAFVAVIRSLRMEINHYSNVILMSLISPTVDGTFYQTLTLHKPVKWFKNLDLATNFYIKSNVLSNHSSFIDMTCFGSNSPLLSLLASLGFFFCCDCAVTAVTCVAVNHESLDMMVVVNGWWFIWANKQKVNNKQ